MERVKRNRIKKLLRTPSPLPDESLISYIFRLAAANQCESIKWVLDLIGIKLDKSYLFRTGWKKLCYPHLDLSFFKLCTGLTDDQIREMRHEVFYESEYLQGIYTGSWNIPDYAIDYIYPKICTKCLREASYCRKIWDLVPLTICPLHKVILINICPACSSKITWNRKYITKCLCGYDWCEIKQRRVKDLDLKVLKFLMLPPSPIIGENCESLQIDNRFTSLNFGDKCRLLVILSQLFSYMEKGRKPIPYGQNNLSHKIMMATISLLSDWPLNLYHFLDRIPGVNINQLIRGLDRLEDYTRLEFLGIAIDEYLQCSSLTQNSPSFRRYILLEYTRHFFGQTKVNLDVMFSTRQVRTLNGVMNPKKVLVDTQSLNHLLDKRYNMLTINKACDRLGVDSDQLLDMIHHNFLKLTSGPNIDGFPDIRLSEDTLEDLYHRIEKIADYSIYSKVIFSDQIVQLDTVVKLSSSKLSFGKLMLAILNRKIIPYKMQLFDNGSGFCLLRHFVYRKDEVEQYMAKIAVCDNK